MPKKIDRSRIEAGRFVLPNKLAFLLDDKVDFLSVAERDGEWAVELPAAALRKLVRGKTELKALKAQHKLDTGSHADALAAAEAGQGETRAALAKAEQRIRALEKKLATAAAAAGGTGPAAKTVAPRRSSRPVPQVTYPHPPAEGGEPASAPAAGSGLAADAGPTGAADGPVTESA